MKGLQSKFYIAIILSFFIFVPMVLSAFYVESLAILIGILFFGSALFFIVLYMTLKSMLKPMIQMEKATNEVASGNLSFDESGEMGELSQSFDQMVSSIHQLIQKTNGLSDEVTISSDELSLVIKEIRDISDRVTDSIRQISNGSISQTEQAKESLGAMVNLQETISEVSEKVLNLSNVASNASEEAEDGKGYIDQNIDQMAMINESVHKLAKFIEKLNSQTSEIDNIIEVITNISKQTNLLALNASIEAARAGDHGKGFMVVADEVKKLADESEQSANQISSIIHEVNENALQAVDYTKVLTAETDKGTSVANDTSKKLLNIIDSIQHISSEFNTLYELSNTISNHSTNVSELMNQTIQISEENTIEVETVAASSEENLASMEQMQEMSDRLNRHAKDLRLYVSQFDRTKQFKLGLSLPTAYHGWMGALVETTKKETLKHEHMDTLFLTSKNASEQHRDMREFLDADVDAVVILPHDDSVTPLVEEAYSKGIDVLILDRDLNTSKYTVYLGGDNEETGRGSAEVLVDTLKQEKGEVNGRIIEIKGVQAPISDIRRKGFINMIEKYPGIELVASEFGDFDREKAYKVTKRLLKEHHDAEFVYSHDDDMTMGIVRAIRDLGKENEVRILSCAGMKDVYKMIKNHERPKILVSVTYSPTMGATAVDFMTKYLEKKELVGNWTKIDDKKYIIPGIKVTERNIEKHYDPNAKW
ncbi:methyl-accepting chemotaxis protein [Salinibacillus xinjiangensis]|uniref:methyl-accepting chemotaxis protein n=1 Tax=Salinibacillus xinjiangensis TaxID=1229268 RepID=UPI001891E2AD|nr:methyl-accepting chemotaxis protein [Salinibacillus xinjiangensis]